MLRIRSLIRWRWAHTNMQMTAPLMNQLKKVMWTTCRRSSTACRYGLIIIKWPWIRKKLKTCGFAFEIAFLNLHPLLIDRELIERTKSFKLLGVRHQNTLKWNDHVMEITKKANRRMFCLRECRRANLPTEVGIACYTTKIRPLLEYGSPVWGGIPQCLAEELENIQFRCLRIYVY